MSGVAGGTPDETGRAGVPADAPTRRGRGRARGRGDNRGDTRGHGRIRVGLATSSVFPEPVGSAFTLAERLGYDGVEVLVTADPTTQDPDALATLAAAHGIPVLSVHAPCLLITARVWGTDPAGKIARSVNMAEGIGATTVVTHPPFVWQRTAADDFPAAVAELQARTDVVIAIENMFPVRILGASVNTYRPHWDPVPAGFARYALDLSHCAAAGVDATEMAARMGDGLAHVHLGDGSGAPRDEHLIPGRGIANCAGVLAGLAGRGFEGSVIVEVSTRKRNPDGRELDLAEALAFARWHLGQ